MGKQMKWKELNSSVSCRYFYGFAALITIDFQMLTKQPPVLPGIAGPWHATFSQITDSIIQYPGRFFTAGKSN